LPLGHTEFFWLGSVTHWPLQQMALGEAHLPMPAPHVCPIDWSDLSVQTGKLWLNFAKSIVAGRITSSPVL
jgi:hypothetical protein